MDKGGEKEKGKGKTAQGRTGTYPTENTPSCGRIGRGNESAAHAGFTAGCRILESRRKNVDLGGKHNNHWSEIPVKNKKNKKEKRMEKVMEIKICNVAPVDGGKKMVGHKFDVIVENAVADGNARVEWFERSDRIYGALKEEEVWEDLFAKYGSSEDPTNLFRQAYDALPEEWEEKEIRFTIHDEPSVTIGGMRCRKPGEGNDGNSRRLDFVIIIQLKEDNIYVAACRQVIVVNDQKETMEEAYFQTTGFVKKTPEEAEEIRGELSAYRNMALTEIFAENELKTVLHS